MATNFPGSLDSFTNPSATDKMDSVTVPHATQHANLNDAVEALEAKVGVDSSAVTSSLDYKVATLETDVAAVEAGTLTGLTVNTNELVVDANGLVGIGTSIPPAHLTLQAASTGSDDGTMEIHSWMGNPASPTEVEDWPTPILALRGFDSYNRQSILSFGYPQDAIYQTGNSVWNFRLETSGGNATASTASTHLELFGPGTFKVGALSKSSGSFQIPHPLPEKADTHDLVHSFIEGPQADLIYRGRATLVNGQATINIDESAGMTEGTFVALCRDIQCFTSNESGWIAVRGSVTGNTLTIEAQDGACTDTISWMVVGERQDQHMIDTNWTDETGKVIVEPLTTRNPDEEN